MSEEKLVPKLRFLEFTDEWSEHKFENIFDIKNGLNKGKDYFGEGIRILNYMDVNKYELNTENTIKGLVELTDDEIERYSVKPNDLFFTRTSETSEEIGLTSAYMGNTIKCVFSGFLLRARPKIDLNSLFFAYYLRSPRQRNNIIKFSSITTRALISGGNLSKMKIKYTSIEEQNKIATFLSLLDERIATQNKIIDKLQSLIKGLNDSLYAQYGGKILTSFAKLGTSYSGLSGKSAQDFGSGKPFITYLNVYSNNVINENDFQYVAIKDGEKQNVVEYGDVLFTLSSETSEEVGIGSVYLGKEKVYLNSFCFGIHITNTEVAFPPYLSYYVSSTAFRKFIYPYAQGSTRFNLCKADFEKASIKLPTLENQKRIYSILSHIDNKIETERQMLELYNSQKQYLLRQMFI